MPMSPKSPPPELAGLAIAVLLLTFAALDLAILNLIFTYPELISISLKNYIFLLVIKRMNDIDRGRNHHSYVKVTE